METRTLGRTGLEVSALCLGTMTWGEQNTEAEAHAQMDMALDYGVNFFDTAELYPVPPNAKTQGRTESYIGSWLAKRGNRERVILATKVVGPGLGHFREGNHKHDKASITKALNGSLKRLGTDTIDLYYLHWPERKTNYFGQLGYSHAEEDSSTPIAETLEVLAGFIKAGKIRHIGLSNETAWGLMAFIREAELNGLPRICCIQNPYSLLNRSFEVGLAEAAIREDCGLNAYSPLAFGVLSGKYLGGAKPEGARLTLFSYFTRYLNERAEAATQAYVGIAKKHGLNPAQMALAYVTSRRFVTSNIIGATTLEQLKSNLESTEITLSAEVLEEIEAVQTTYPNPCP